MEVNKNGKKSEYINVQKVQRSRYNYPSDGTLGCKTCAPCKKEEEEKPRSFIF